jgi:WD and tetratricopeptide repeat-containing protein 1
VILWNGETGRKLVRLATDHAGNIFSVKFLPDSGDRALVTGAQDARVCLLDVPRETVVQSAAFHFGRVSLVLQKLVRTGTGGEWIDTYI